MKSAVAKDWFLHVGTAAGKRKVKASLEKVEAKSLADIPDLVSVAEAAEKLKARPKTVHDWMSKKLLRSIKRRGRRFTTAEWIADFWNDQAANG